jgi:hypothetical protein
VRLCLPTSRLRASVYRVPAETVEGEARKPALPVETVAVLLWVLACSLLRFGLFVFRGERVGIDPVLALAAAWASVYTLARLVRT